MISGSDPSSNSVATIGHSGTEDTQANLHKSLCIRRQKHQHQQQQQQQRIHLPFISQSVTCLLLLLLNIQVQLANGEYVARPQPDYDETGAIEGVECISNGKFYRNPEFKDGVRDCAKYYWCPRGKVLEFRCSAGLWFDVDRQICDFKAKVRNCEKSHGKCI